MIGVIINTVAVIIGSVIGLLFKKGISEKIANAAMLGMGLVCIYIGISGSLKGENTLVLVISIIVGGIIGTALDIDGFLNRLGDKLEKKLSSNGKEMSITQGFVSGSMLFCVGSMTIVGSLNAGLSGDIEMLLIKSVMDCISSVMLSVTLGIGVMFAAAFVLVFQGAIVLLAGVIAPVMTASAIAETVCAGSLLIIGIGLNLMKVTKIKTADYLPAILVAPILTIIIDSIPALAAIF